MGKNKTNTATKEEKKDSIVKKRTGVIFGGFALLALCAGVILLITGVKNMLTPFSYPESTLSPTKTETTFIENRELVTKIAIPGTTYSMYVPDGSFAGDNAVFFDTYGDVVYAITCSNLPAEDWIVGDLNKGVLNFYSEGKDTVFSAYITDVGYLNGYELCYYAGVANTEALGKSEEVYSVTYELEVADGKYLLISAATMNKYSLEQGKSLLDAMVFTLVLDDESLVVPTDESVVEEGAEDPSTPIVNEDGHVIGEVDGVWYEYLNMQDYVNKPWKEEVLEDGRYGYSAPISCEGIEEDVVYVEVFFTPEDMQNVSFAKDVYLMSVDKGAINYHLHIEPFSIQGNYLYFQIQNCESEYFNYMLIGTSDVPMVNFSPRVFTPEEWKWYMNLYPGDEDWGVPGYELPGGWEDVTQESSNETVSDETEE